MPECPKCFTTHVANTLFCGECGTYLLEAPGRDTDPVGAEMAPHVTSVNRKNTNIDGLIRTKTQTIRLRIENNREIEIELHKAVHIGRLDPGANLFPEVDLTQDDGLIKGVSRRHARLVRYNDAVMVEDLGSTNGTFINGEKLTPYRSEVLSNGDCLRLGQLAIEVWLH